MANLVVKGPDVKAILAALGEKIQKKLIAHAMPESGRAIHQMAVAGAATGSGRDKHPGALKASIKVRSIPRKGSRVGVEVGTDAEEAAPTEFGTHKEAARPFLRPALESRRNMVTRLIGEDVQSAAEESA